VCAVERATNVDRAFLSFVSDLLLCSRCLRAGVRTPVRQVISHRHRPQSLCRDCRGAATRSTH
jgi:hypothetical protein